MAAARADGEPRAKPTRSACRPTSACTCGAGATPPIPSTSPSTTSCGARRRWRRRAARRSASAGVGVDDVAHLDLYSCFGELAELRPRRARASRDDDSRPLTVTGGLPYHGGAGEQLHDPLDRDDGRRAARRSRARTASVSGVGMHMTKHVYGVYSTEPGPVQPPDAGARAGQARRRTRCRTIRRRARRRRDRRRVLGRPRPRRRARVGACWCATSTRRCAHVRARVTDADAAGVGGERRSWWARSVRLDAAAGRLPTACTGRGAGDVVQST